MPTEVARREVDVCERASIDRDHLRVDGFGARVAELDEAPVLQAEPDSHFVSLMVAMMMRFTTTWKMNHIGRQNRAAPLGSPVASVWK